MGIKENDKDLYAYQLMADIFDQVGIHDGTMMAYHQTQWDNEDNAAYLKGIEQLQYDILYGKRYCYNGDINKYPASDIVMGVDEVIISSMNLHTDEEENDWVVLKGEGFTQWSRVYVNGNKIATTYVSGNELWIDSNRIDEGDTVVVNQNGSKSTIFRSSNEFIYSLSPVDDSTEDSSPDTETTEDTKTIEDTEINEDTEDSAA